MDAQERLHRHVAASLERDRWAKRAIDLLAAGKKKPGMAAARKAEKWDAKVKALESVATSTPHAHARAIRWSSAAKPKR